MGVRDSSLCLSFRVPRTRSDMAKHFSVDLHEVADAPDVWLPAVATGRVVAPPAVDIAWVWHLHKLAPAAYRSHCIQRFGFVVSAPNLAFKWQRDTGDSGCTEHHSDKCSPLIFRDTVASVTAMAVSEHEFLWQVRILRPGQPETVEAVANYFRFLHLVAMFPNITPVPTCEIDIVWHAHMLADPVQYDHETRSLTGRDLLLAHHVASSQEATKQLRRGWQHTCSRWGQLFRVPIHSSSRGPAPHEFFDPAWAERGVSTLVAKTLAERATEGRRTNACGSRVLPVGDGVSGDGGGDGNTGNCCSSCCEAYFRHTSFGEVLCRCLFQS